MFTIRTNIVRGKGIRVVFQTAEEATDVIDNVVKKQKLVRVDRELLAKVKPDELKKVRSETLTGLKDFLTQYKDDRFVSREFKAFADNMIPKIEQHLASVAAPKVTTEAPKVTTEAPKVTTEAPKVTTEAPKVTTEAPKVTTEAPKVTTEAPKVTTEAPKVTTEAPKVTTEAPKVTTEAPKVTTEAPKVTTEAPKVTTEAPKVTTEAPKVTTEAPKVTTEAGSDSSLATVKLRLNELETRAQSLAESGNEEELVKVEAQIAAIKRRISVLEKQQRVQEQRTFSDSVKDTAAALKDVSEFDSFIAKNFTKIEINGGLFFDGQVYYIANGAKNPQVAELLKKDDSPIRDVFLQKMSAVNVKVSGKDYPAIATRDALLSNYKRVENKTSLNNAVAFDAREYDKVLSELKAVETSLEATAKGLTAKFISLQKKNPEQAKQFLRTSINGTNPTPNSALEEFLADPALKSALTRIEPDLVQNKIKAILDGKSPAFVMNDTGIAFDGVSLVEGATIKGKMEGKNNREGFYEVKSSSIDAFIKDIPDTDGYIKNMITKADGNGPIELGGKVFEVKGGKVLSLGKPDGSAFSLMDCLPSDYRTQDGIRDAIILALAIKVWGLPNISLSLPNISLSLPNLPNISLPSLSSAATHLLIGFGLGWFVARLVYGDDAEIGSNVQTLNKYQTAYNRLASKKDNPSSYLVQGSEYKHMTWDVEKDGTKIFRPLGKPQTIEGVDIMLLAIKVDGMIDIDKTIVKDSSEKLVKLSSLTNATAIVQKIDG